MRRFRGRLKAMADGPGVEPSEDYTTLAQSLFGDAAKRVGNPTAVA
jgi:hypothetical protein